MFSVWSLLFPPESDGKGFFFLFASDFTSFCLAQKCRWWTCGLDERVVCYNELYGWSNMLMLAFGMEELE
jgi:hypothetical protein